MSEEAQFQIAARPDEKHGCLGQGKDQAVA